MRDAAADERFEDAARYRNRLFAIENLAEKQGADRRETGSIDVIGIAVEGDRAAVQVFPLRGGKMIDRHGFHLENVEGQDVTDRARGVLPRVLRQRAVDAAAARSSRRRRRDSRRSSSSCPSCAARASRCARRERARSGGSRSWRRRTRSSRSTSETLVSEQKRLRRVSALEELREALNLESLPLRIECFDISNIQGHEIVGSMVVFQDGMPKKAHYRKFGVRGLDGQDDFAAMAEVVSRRFARLDSGTGEDYDEGFATAPNLVVIDGGKGQLSAALAAMQAYDLPRVAVISLAKRIEEVFVPGRPDPILLDPHSAGLQLLQRVRDEAHRFALDFHRQRRSARAKESLFDTLEGVGPVRRRALIQHFGSTESVLAASQEELEGVRACPRRPRARSTRSCTRPAAASGSAAARPALAIERQSMRPSIRKSAVKPMTTFVTISVSFIPTENESSFAVETDPLKT